MTNNKCRINKKEARRRFNQGEDITLVACKMRVDSPWGLGCRINNKDDRDFDKIVNNFEYYNCTSETGYYASYYIEQ